MRRNWIRQLIQIAQGEPGDPALREAILTINIQRVRWLSGIFALVHGAHIAIFWPYVPSAVSVEDQWKNGVIVVHATMLAAIGVFLPTLTLLRRRKGGSHLALRVLTGAIALWYLLGGASLAIVDQLVTANITPLLLATIGVAMVFVVPPVVAAVNYLLLLTIFSLGIGWTQTDPDLLLTNRVNSISATGLAFGMAVLQWRNQVRTIRQQRRIEEQQRELEAKNRELTLLATRDVLTGLLNRAQFVHDVNREVARMRRSGGEACLLLLDIDHFKQVNDTYGHPAGDDVLRGVAHILSRTLRVADLRARFGGEEFAVLLVDTSLAKAIDIAERLRAAIAAEQFQVGEDFVRVTASFGVAMLSVGGLDPLEECYRVADAALYQAKQAGRNCVRWAGEVPSATAQPYVGLPPAKLA